MRKRTNDIIIPWEMVLLALLSKEDMYGSQIAKEVKTLSNGKLTILMGSMYPILYRLADEQCVEFYEKAVGRRLTVVYYHITEKGRERMADLLKEFREDVKIVESIMSGI
ncbi:MAG: PadR family transcriptional regulator [Butyrivibrio sp.]|nr:PadR family transcriptional regulator [Butyrivibrio sp.]